MVYLEVGHMTCHMTSQELARTGGNLVNEVNYIGLWQIGIRSH